MSPKLSVLEIELLRKVLNGEAFTMPSHQRVRLELLGVIRDSAAGVIVTSEGQRLAKASPGNVFEEAPMQKHDVPLNRRGRRMPHHRKSVF